MAMAWRGRGGRRGGVAMGCLIAAGVVVVLLIVAGVFVAMNWKGWAASGMQAVGEAAIDQADLPDAEKPELKAIVKDLTAGLRSGDVTFEEIGRIFEAAPTSTAFYAGAVTVFDLGYVQRSKLPDEERAAGSLALNRFQQGLISGALGEQDAKDVLGPLQTTDAQGNSELKPPAAVTDEELRTAIAAAKAKADGAGIPEARVDVDLSDEFRKMIEQALGRPLAPSGG